MKQKALDPEAKTRTLHEVIRLCGATNYDIDLKKLGEMPSIRELMRLEEKIKYHLLSDTTKKDRATIIEQLQTIRMAYRIKAESSPDIDTANAFYFLAEEITNFIASNQAVKSVRTRRLFDKTH